MDRSKIWISNLDKDSRAASAEIHIPFLPYIERTNIVGSVHDTMLHRQFKWQEDFLTFCLKYQRLGQMSLPERIAYYCTSIMVECGEVLDNVRGWKPHQINPPPIDYANLHEEIADIAHFLIHLAIEADLTPEGFHEAFFDKQQINRKRQMEGY